VNGRNSIVKSSQFISEHNAKISPKNFIPLPRNSKKRISLSYDVNDHVYSKLKFV